MFLAGIEGAARMGEDAMWTALSLPADFDRLVDFAEQLEPTRVGEHRAWPRHVLRRPTVDTSSWVETLPP